MSKFSTNLKVENNFMNYISHIILTNCELFDYCPILGECLDAVYDITVAYPDGKPVTEQDVVNGMLPKEIHFHIKRYIIS